MLKKAFLIYIIVTLLVIGTASPLRANAQLPVTDISHALITGSGWLAEAARFALEKVIGGLLEALRKRLLDTIVDQTIAWINGDTNNPQFVQNFAKTFEDAKQAAVGDTLQKIGVGQLCGPLNLQVELRLNRNQPVFSRQVTCTLDQVIQNVNAFRDNFSAGGWLAYREVLKPQNNQWGMDILVTDQLFEDTAKRRGATEAEVAGGNSFLSTKICDQWSLIEKVLGKTVERRSPVPTANLSILTPPALPAGLDPSLFQWECKPEDQRVTTPGAVIGGAATKAIGSDIDYLVNSQELSAYLGAIMDAAINRLIRTGAQGLTNMIQSQSTTGNTTPSFNPTTYTYTPGAVNQVSSTNNAYAAGQQQIADQVRISIISQIDPIIKDLQSAQTTLTSFDSTALTAALNQLYACAVDCTTSLAQGGKGYTTPDPALSQSQLSAIQTIQAQKSALLQRAATSIAALNTLKTALNAAATVTAINQLDKSAITNAQAVLSDINALGGSNGLPVLSDINDRLRRCQPNFAAGTECLP